MSFKKLTDELSVSAQLSLEDVDVALDAGFKSFICNRPDGEELGQPTAAEIQQRIKARGGHFVSIPVSGGNFPAEAIAAYKAAVEIAEKPCLAYCRSGTRSTVLWAFGQVHERPIDEIIHMAVQAGYDISGVLSQLR